jgi:membrane-associated phospholipid phosphatase
MTAVNGIGHDRPEPAWRRGAMNVMAAVTLLARPARITPGAPFFPAPRKLAIITGALLAALLVGMAFIDIPASSAAARMPRWLISFFDEITDYGKSGWFLWPLGILFLLLAALPPILPRVSQMVLAAIMVRVGFLFVAIAVPGIFVAIIKRVIGRARPLVASQTDAFAFSPFRWSSEYAGLPSGHATTAFSVLVAFGLLFPRARPLLALYAALIVISRVVVTAHYPTDVLAGALVGTLGVLLVRRYFALRRLGFAIGADGVPHAYPGPSRRRIKAVARGLLA